MNLELLGLPIDIVQVWIVLALMLEELYTKTISAHRIRQLEMEVTKFNYRTKPDVSQKVHDSISTSQEQNGCFTVKPVDLDLMVLVSPLISGSNPIALNYFPQNESTRQSTCELLFPQQVSCEMFL